MPTAVGRVLVVGSTYDWLDKLESMAHRDRKDGLGTGSGADFDWAAEQADDVVVTRVCHGSHPPGQLFLIQRARVRTRTGPLRPL